MQSLTYTFAAHLSLAAHIELDRLLAMHCQLYNSALEERRAAYSHSRQSLSFAAQSRELTGLRADDPTLGCTRSSRGSRDSPPLG